MQPNSGPRKKASLNWLRVALIAFLIGAIALIAVFFPVVRQAIEDREAQRISEFYSTGLSPCDSDFGEVDALIRTYVPGEPTTTIIAFPTFSRPEAIRVVGDHLYYLDLPSPHSDPGPAHIEGAPLSSETSRALASLLSGDIRHAKVELPPGLDGTTYLFNAGTRGCARAWSPEPTTRAGKLVSLFYKLANHAKGPSTATNGDQNVLAAISALKGP